MSPLIHIVRHGEALHNVQWNYPTRDPPLTKAGHYATKHMNVLVHPDLILTSPMTRTIQTALNMFPSLSEHTPLIPVQIWPDLREAHDAECNKGLSRLELQIKFTQFDFSLCHEEWDYVAHTVDTATARAEEVRKKLKDLSLTYQNIFVITHRGFKTFLVKGKRFGLAETRPYRFATEEEAEDEKVRWGVNSDTFFGRGFWAYGADIG